MAPEGHGAQVLPDPDLGSKKVTLQLLFYNVFTKTHGWGSRGPPDPLFAPHTRGVGSTGSTPPLQEPSRPWGPPPGQISSQSVQQFGFLQRTNKYTQTHTHIALYVLDNLTIWSHCIWNKNCNVKWTKLFYCFAIAQCDHIGRFLKFLGAKFFAKVSQIFSSIFRLLWKWYFLC